jgi:hypothetical protein
MAEVPVSVGALQETVTAPPDTAAFTLVGEPGSGLTICNVDEAALFAPLPTEFVAATVNV